LTDAGNDGIIGAQFDFSLKDRRDASYWEIVNPLFEEVERTASFVWH